MSSWEDTKRAAQSVYNDLGNGYHNMRDSIGSAYQQILISGHLYPQADRNAINQEMAEPSYEPTPEDWKEYGEYVDQYTPAPDELFYLNHFHDNPDQDAGLEPER